MERQPHAVEESNNKKKSMMPAMALASAIAMSPGVHAGQAETTRNVRPEQESQAQIESGVDASYASMAEIILKRWKNVYEAERKGDAEHNREAVKKSMGNALEQFLNFSSAMGGDKGAVISAFESELEKLDVSNETRDAFREVIEPSYK